ncbi:MAG: 16S rRNA (adenine(1518)-N(6)/adenine(1519)-N(6))-dimethyltransferase RsmA [Acidobacteriota bacterium]|nr:16S rRNA (adenine(1518)-N(6)/adenine(1519)-N(6))-dimethyltransferase RsmA [Acidobacteriota bacterium]
MSVHSWLASPRETRRVLERHGLVAKHHLGQNFLIDDTVVGRTLDLAELAGGDVVLEVGPGIGTLTVAMLPMAGAVASVEADRGLEAVLAETCAQDSERFALVMGDALRVGLDDLRASVAALGIEGLDPAPTKLVSNLPYQVAATMVLRTFERMPSVWRAVVMVQAEVADRMGAIPGTKEYGGYTAKLALHARPTGRFEVGPGSFMPAPHVDSAVIRLDRASLDDPATGASLSPAQVAWCAQVIDAAFAQRRKTIRNSMGSSGFGKPELDEALSRSGIDPRARAETLAPDDFVRLAAALGWR